MLKSAENFMAGFFGLEWYVATLAYNREMASNSRTPRTNNATLELIVEKDGYNNSLAGYMNCPNSAKDEETRKASKQWKEIYLQDGKLDRAALISFRAWSEC